MADKYLLEDGSGGYLLEDGSGVLLLEDNLPMIAYPVLQSLAGGTIIVNVGLQGLSGGFAAVVGGGAFVVDGVNITAGTDGYYRVSALSSASDSPTGTLSLWFNASGTSVGSGIFSSNGMVLTFNPDGSFYFDIAADAGYTNYYAGYNGAGGLADGNWHHIMISWDTNAALGLKTLRAAVDDAVYTFGAFDEIGGAFSAFFATMTGFNLMAFGGTPAGSDDIEVAEVYLNTVVEFDPTLEADRRKFIGADGKPVDLGSDGSNPSGSQPAIYLSVRQGDSAADLATDRGFGGNFSVIGSPSISSTSPSD